jgi:hypothetical protein
MKNILFVLIFATVVNLISANYNENYFSFTFSDKKELIAIGKVVSIDNVIDGKVWAYATDKQFEAFKRFGISYELLPNPGSLYQAIMADSKETMRDWDYYPTYAAYVSMMQQFQTDYPALCQIVNIGSTVQGRELLVARISDNVGVDEAEPEFFFTSSMHGDETTGYVLMLRLINHLLTNYGTDTRITNLVNNVDIFINPLANPDGTYASGNHTVTGATRNNANGVDLNRNFPDFVDGPHPDGNNWQMETVAMMNFAGTRNFILSANIHGGTVVLNYPYDTTVQRHADDIWWQIVCHEYADEAQANSPNGYMEGFNDGITNGFDWYSINGGRQDYMNYYHHCREMTLEISQTKLLPENQLPAYWNYNKESFLLYMEQILYGVRGIVQNIAGNPLSASITIPGHDLLNSHIFTDSATGNFHRMLAPGNWNLLISAEGYISQQVENMNVTNHSITNLAIILQTQGTVNLAGVVRNGETNALISNAQVTLVESPYNPVYTNAQGEFFLNGILEDIYTVSITKTGYATNITQILVNSENHFFEFQLFESQTISFENGQFPTGWQFGGNANWLIVSNTAYDGDYAAKSGTISHNQTSSVSVTLDVSTNSIISFYRKVSSENNYDFLHFSIDNVVIGSWSGERNWEGFSYPIAAGQRTVKWSYEKDGSVSNGSDCAWIDSILLPPLVMQEPQLVVFPASFQTEMAMNSQQTAILQLTNIGGGLLAFEINSSLLASWLQVNQISGTIPASEMCEIELLFDSTGLIPNTYNCELMILDNRMETIIPITLTVNQLDVSTDISIPLATELLGNFPNPFNPETSISFALHTSDIVTLNIFNIKGQKIKTFQKELSGPGIYQINWNGRDENNKKVSSGIYFYHFQTNEYEKMAKMLLLQ